MKINLKNTILALAAFAMVGGATAVGVSAFGNNAVETKAADAYGKVAITDLATGDEVVVVGVNSSGSYALANNNGTSTAPSAISVTVSADKITDPAETVLWTVTVDGSNYQFGTGDSYLYCTNANNGVRVGDNSNNVFSISNNYLYNNATRRYIGIYNSQDWRCYTSINNNIKDQSFEFYKKQSTPTSSEVVSSESSSAISEPTPVPTEITLAADDEITSGVKGSVTTEIVYEVGYEDVEGTQAVTFTSSKESVAVIDSVDTTNKVATVRFLDNAPEGVTITCTSKEDNSISASHTFTVTGLTEPTTVTDVITLSDTGVSGTSYADITEFTKSGSTAKYGGQCAGGNSSIQLRSSNSNSGIVITSAGKVAKSVSVVWNSSTAAGRTLNIYGKNTPYTAATGLYDSSTQGTKLGSIVNGTSTSLTLTGNYHYLGLCSNSGAMYLTSISIVWEQETAASFAGFLNDFESSSSYDCKDFYSEVTKVWGNVTDKSEFTAENYADAYARCVAYATANGQEFDNTSGFHKAMTVNFGANKDSNVFLLAALATVGLVSVGGMILLAKKRKKA